MPTVRSGKKKTIVRTVGIVHLIEEPPTHEIAFVTAASGRAKLRQGSEAPLCS